MPNNLVILVSGIIKNGQGELLLLKRSKLNKSYQNCWQLPEGKIEFGEQPEDALKREIQEETNLSTISANLITVLATEMSVRDEKYHVIRIVYGAKCQGTAKISMDHTQLRWFPLKKVRNIKKIDGLDQILKYLTQ